MSEPGLRAASGDELDARVLEALLRLRQQVFIVEQGCAYADIDGHDLEAATRHLWIEAAGRAIATLRVRPDRSGSAHWIGRVCTAPEARGRGLATRLLHEAMASTPGRLRLNAQERLVTWYSSFGFRVSGPAFDEDGIRHVPMRAERG